MPHEPSPNAFLLGMAEKSLIEEAKHLVYFPLGAASELLDFYGPFLHILVAGKPHGIVPVLCGPEADTRYPSVLHQLSEGWDGLTEEWEAYTFVSALSFAGALEQKARFIGAFLGGGRAPEYIRDSEPLNDLLRHFDDHQLPIGMTCHGVELLGSAGLLTGRSVTTVTKCRHDVLAADGTYLEEPAHVDRNIHSWKTYLQAHLGLGAFFEALVEVARSRDAG